MSSQANGPGRRAVLWLQGCSLGCSGCFNPDTHSLEGGTRYAVHEVFDQVMRAGADIEGVTLSGGEPLQQFKGVLELVTRIRRQTSLSMIVFTGYQFEEVQRMPKSGLFLSHIDVLIAGRYDATQRLGHGLLGSANKTLHFMTNRYGPDSLRAVPEAEVFVTSAGEVVTTGINPPDWTGIP